MICSNCGKEIIEKSLYCNHCGKEVQIVPEYSLLDEEILASFIEDPDVKKERLANENSYDSVTLSEDDDKKNSRFAFLFSTKKRKWIFFGTIALILLILISCMIYRNSYNYYCTQGEKSYKASELEQSLSSYLKAYKKNPNGTDALLGLGLCYYEMQDYTTAENYLLSCLRHDSANVDAVTYLVHIYTMNNDTASLDGLYSLATGDALTFVTDIIDLMVSFSEEEGDYSSDLLLQLSCPGAAEIIYTLDGSTPSKNNGMRYDEPILLTAGTSTVSAIAYSTAGDAGLIYKQEYTITYQSPDFPNVYPRSGTYTSATTISILAKDGETVYYTWDGSLPTIESEIYTEPLTMPEGNNILSLVVVNEEGLMSEVMKLNYIYIPE